MVCQENFGKKLLFSKRGRCLKVVAQGRLTVVQFRTPDPCVLDVILSKAPHIDLNSIQLRYKPVSLLLSLGRDGRDGLPGPRGNNKNDCSLASTFNFNFIRCFFKLHYHTSSNRRPPFSSFSNKLSSSSLFCHYQLDGKCNNSKIKVAKKPTRNYKAFK